jgi:hypothetical protein
LKSTKTTIFAVTSGIAITLLTGFVDHTPETLVGAVYYGYPFAWVEMLVIAPGYFPWVVRPVKLLLDILIWSIIVGVILFVISKVRKNSN